MVHPIHSCLHLSWTGRGSTRFYKIQPGLAQTIFCYFAIASSILLFVYGGLFQSLDILDSDLVKTDSNQWYTAGKLWNEGQNPYEFELYGSRYEEIIQAEQLRETSAFYNPSQANMLFGLLSGLSLRTAYLVLRGVNLFLLISTLILLACILSWYWPILSKANKTSIDNVGAVIPALD